MNDMGSMSREHKKRQLRQQIVSSKTVHTREEESREIVQKAAIKIWKRRIIISFIVLLVIGAAGFFVYRYYTSYQFDQYEVSWELPMNESSFARYEKFGGNVLKYSKDGASYIDGQGKSIWVQSYEMKSPSAAVNGDFIAIADQQGNKIYICDKSGYRGEVTTLLPIVRVTISAHGVVAAILEDSKANYIQFYKSDGSQLNIAIKGTIQGTGTDPVGYPLDISLSPDGTQLIGSYLYMSAGAMKGRVAFHNFSEIGKNGTNRLVAGFHDEFASSIVPRVKFLTEIESVAFADNKLVFFSSHNLASPKPVETVEITGDVRSILYSEKYAGIIVNNTEGENPYRMDIYKGDGTKVFSEEFDFQYSHADIDGDSVILYNENSCRVYSMSGVERFAGDFDFTISKVTKGAFPNTLILTGPEMMKEIKFK